MPQKIIAHAAEAIILQDDCRVIKQRIAKGYRIQTLDEKLRKLRTRSEARIMLKLQNKINVPKILSVNEKTKEIIMSFIDGKKLSENLEKLNWKKICREIGEEIAKMHDFNIIHGDLTTSNMIYVENSELNNEQQSNLTDSELKKQQKDFSINDKLTNKCLNNSSINNTTSKQLTTQWQDNLTINNKKENFKVFFIDFGLGFHSSRIEDKAIDLHLLKQALEAKHFAIFQECFKIILDNYNSKDKSKILEQLKRVEARGRYKH